jgi:hypothetical protein
MTHHRRSLPTPPPHSLHRGFCPSGIQMLLPQHSLHRNVLHVHEGLRFRDAPVPSAADRPAAGGADAVRLREGRGARARAATAAAAAAAARRDGRSGRAPRRPRRPQCARPMAMASWQCLSAASALRCSVAARGPGSFNIYLEPWENLADVLHFDE